MARASERACNGLVTSGDQVNAVRAAAAQAPGRVEGPGVQLLHGRAETSTVPSTKL